MSDTNLHKGHRKNVRNRFITEGSLDSFKEHEVLELLLFYAYPMKDTNEIAHRILDKYGSLQALLNDTPEGIMSRASVTENVAVLLSIIPHINRKIALSRIKKGISLAKFSKASEYLSYLLYGCEREKLYALLLDLKKNYIKSVAIAEGNERTVSFSSKKLVDDVLISKARFVILGHNHPDEIQYPSQEDIELTTEVKNLLSPLGVCLLDHIIVCNSDYMQNYSFARNGIL